MSNGRVLATPGARSAVPRLETILSGDLLTTVRDLERQDDTLADPISGTAVWPAGSVSPGPKTNPH
jgi:hypothetical protein